MSSTSRDGILAVCGSFIVLSGVAVGLRFYGRRHQRLSLLADDWTAVAGVITYYGTCVLIFILSAKKAIGYSSTDFTEKELSRMFGVEGRISYAFDFINTSTLALTKLSALFFYRRVFHVGYGVVDWFNRIIVALLAIIVAWWITFLVLSAFQCPGHFSALWNGNSAQYCTLNLSWAMSLAVSDFVLDLIVLALPIPRIWKLNTSARKKLSIIGVLCLAFVGLGASLARIVIYAESQIGGQAYFFTHDFERTNTKIAYIQMLESGISVTAVNLPSLWKVCTSILPQKFAFVTTSFRDLLSSFQQRSRHPSEGGSSKLQSDRESIHHHDKMDLQYPTRTLNSDRGEEFGHSVTIYAMQDLNSDQMGERYNERTNDKV